MEGIDRAAITETWLKKHRSTYLKATRHFHSRNPCGTVDLSSFKRWLVDQLFGQVPKISSSCRLQHDMSPPVYDAGARLYICQSICSFVASVLLKAWKESDDKADVDVLLGGVAALNDEIAWFKREASKWDVALDSIVPQQANLDYCRFLESLISSDVDFTQAITAFWAIEVVYQESFAHCLEADSRTPQELKETCQRWGNDGFGQYCHALQSIANRRLEKASDEVVAKAEVHLLKVLEYEVEFWNMGRGTF